MTRLDALSLGVSIGALALLTTRLLPADLPLNLAAGVLLAFS